jgi:hypothetical protein
MDDPLRRVAAGLLLEMVLQQGGMCDFVELDGLCDQTVRELGMIHITRPGTFRSMRPGDIRAAVVGELNGLIRRGMLSLASHPNNRWLVVRARDGMTAAVTDMLKDVR